MSRFQSRKLVGVGRSVPLILAALILLHPSPLRGKDTVAGSKTPAATRKVPGRVLDEVGRPVPAAAVFLTRADEVNDVYSSPTLLAQTQTKADGRFELSVLESELQKQSSSPPMVFEIWVLKMGLAIGHSSFSGESCEQPLVVSMESESPRVIQLQTPAGSPCVGATVRPVLAQFLSSLTTRIPQPIRERLNAQSASDGRVSLRGCNQRGLVVMIEKPEFGTQFLVFADKSSPAAPVRLRPTRELHGEIVLPKGEKADLSRARIAVMTSQEGKSPSATGTVVPGTWFDYFSIHPNADGVFVVSHLPEGDDDLRACLPDEMPYVPDARYGFTSRWRTSAGVFYGSLRYRFPGKGYSAVHWQKALKFSFGKFSFDSSGKSSLPKSLVDFVSACLSLETTWVTRFELRKGVRVTRIVRDAQTKRPLPGVNVYVVSSRRAPTFAKAFARLGPWGPVLGLPLCALYATGTLALEEFVSVFNPATGVDGTLTTDEQGRINGFLCPGETYAMSCRLPENYLRSRPGPKAIDEIPAGIDRCELRPIELVPEITIYGNLADASGKPFVGARVRGIFRRGDADAGNKETSEETRWTVTDSQGDFHFGGVEPGTKVALVPIRAGVTLAEPTELVAGDEEPRLRKLVAAAILSMRPIQIRVTRGLEVKERDFVALRGRVVGLDHKAIPDAQVVIEVEHSLDPAHLFRATVYSDGLFLTPAHFPKRLKYRLAVRSILQNVAFSDWICPATAGNRFPDVVVERSKLKLDSKLTGDEIVATLNGQPIRAAVCLEHAFCKTLRSSDGMTLWSASKWLKSGRLNEPEYRKFQDQAIRMDLPDRINDRLQTEALLQTLDAQEQAFAESTIRERWRGCVETLKKYWHVASEQELEQKEKLDGTPLSGTFREYRYGNLAFEYLYRAGHSESDTDRQTLSAYYQAHRQDYAVREKVSWQLLEVEFDDPSKQFPKPEAVTAGAQSNPWADDQTVPAGGTSATTESPGKTKEADFDMSKYAAGLHSNVSRKEARGIMDQALAQLHEGVPFEAVVKKFSTGPSADRGGWQPRARPESLADEKTAAALRQLPEGAPSDVIETDQSFRIVRVACRTPAGYQPFEEVEESIREHIRSKRQTKALEEIYSRAAIESPYIDDAPSVPHLPTDSEPAKEPGDAFAP